MGKKDQKNFKSFRLLDADPAVSLKSLAASTTGYPSATSTPMDRQSKRESKWRSDGRSAVHKTVRDVEAGENAESHRLKGKRNICSPESSGKEQNSSINCEEKLETDEKGPSIKRMKVAIESDFDDTSSVEELADQNGQFSEEDMTDEDEEESLGGEPDDLEDEELEQADAADLKNGLEDEEETSSFFTSDESLEDEIEDDSGEGPLELEFTGYGTDEKSAKCLILEALKGYTIAASQFALIKFSEGVDHSVQVATKALHWITSPIDSQTFFSDFFQKRVFVVSRKAKDYFDGFFGTADFFEMLQKFDLTFGTDVNVALYEKGERTTLNGAEGERASAAIVWRHIRCGRSVQFVRPQRHNDNIWYLCDVLQELFCSFVGANCYLTPPKSSGFAPHWDDIVSVCRLGGVCKSDFSGEKMLQEKIIPITEIFARKFGQDFSSYVSSYIDVMAREFFRCALPPFLTLEEKAKICCGPEIGDSMDIGLETEVRLVRKHTQSASDGIPPKMTRAQHQKNELKKLFRQANRAMIDDHDGDQPPDEQSDQNSDMSYTEKGSAAILCSSSSEIGIDSDDDDESIKIGCTDDDDDDFDCRRKRPNRRKSTSGRGRGRRPVVKGVKRKIAGTSEDELRAEDDNDDLDYGSKIKKKRVGTASPGKRRFEQEDPDSRDSGISLAQSTTSQQSCSQPFSLSMSHICCFDYELITIEKPQVSHSAFRSIEANTLKILFDELTEEEFQQRFILIDCRYPTNTMQAIFGLYSLNMWETSSIEEIFYPEDEERFGEIKARIPIFYCEYSQKRGPKMALALREQDRNRNKSRYPKLDYKQIYILDQGYRQFFMDKDDKLCKYCTPQAYVQMWDSAYTEQRKCYDSHRRGKKRQRKDYDSHRRGKKRQRKEN